MDFYRPPDSQNMIEHKDGERFFCSKTERSTDFYQSGDPQMDFLRQWPHTMSENRKAASSQKGIQKDFWDDVNDERIRIRRQQIRFKSFSSLH